MSGELARIIDVLCNREFLPRCRTPRRDSSLWVRARRRHGCPRGDTQVAHVCTHARWKGFAYQHSALLSWHCRLHFTSFSTVWLSARLTSRSCRTCRTKIAEPSELIATDNFVARRFRNHYYIIRFSRPSPFSFSSLFSFF